MRPWDDPMVDESIEAALDADRIPLTLAVGCSGPAAYLLFLAADRNGSALPAAAPVGRTDGRISALYGPIADGTFPYYTGSAKSLRERLGRHRRNLGGLDGIDVAHFWVAAIPTSTFAWALFVEANLKLIGAPGDSPRLAGLGSRTVGRHRRGGTPSPFSTIHPGRPNWTARPSKVARARAAVNVARQLADLPRGPRWPPLRGRS